MVLANVFEGRVHSIMKFSHARPHANPNPFEYLHVGLLYTPTVGEHVHQAPKRSKYDKKVILK